MGLFSRRQEIVPATPILQGEVVQPGDEDFDTMAALAHQAMRDFKGDPTMTDGAIRELAQCAHLSEEEVRRRLR